jgi:hypothetical protein
MKWISINLNGNTRGTVENGPSRGRRWGLGGRDGAQNEINLNWQKDLMEEGFSKEFWKGNLNDILSATEGNTVTRDRAGIVIGG